MIHHDHPAPDHAPLSELPGIPDALRHAAHLLPALLESAAQAILATDSSGRIVLANSAAARIFGYSISELLGASVETLLPEALREAHVHHRQGYLHNPHVRPMGTGLDLAARHKDGTLFPVEISLNSVRTPQGAFAIAFISDISLRKHLEEQLLHARKMEAVGRLAGGVAHDFNNMLTVIVGYNRLLLDELSTLDPLRGYAEETLKAADRAIALTSQLLSFSRRQVIQSRVVALNEVVSQTGNMLRRLIGEDIHLHFQLSPDAGNLHIDPNHIQQAIVNLVVNARDAMPGGGRITIETSNVQIDGTYSKTHLGVTPGEFVMIAVSDTGHGMDSATRQNIFEPFFTTKPRGQGTGLGLATVYGVVKQNGGDIWVYSEPGKGSTFKLYFPRVTEPASAGQPAETVALSEPAGETILLVEDEEQVRDLTARLLRRLGYSVLTAADGAEAIALCETHSGTIPLLVTDVVMPKMSGKQLADKLTASHPGLKVLFLSGYTESTVFGQGVLDPNVNFLSKPFSRDALARTIRDILGR